MTTGELQQKLFTLLKSKMAEETTAAEEIAALLNISTDSAYRRMRGEKTLSIDELQTLCVHYKVSLDQLMEIQAGGIVFYGQYLDKKTFNFEDYISSMIQNMTYINSFKEKTFYYSCKDLPIFHHYHVREIAAFKWFLWHRTYFQFPEFEHKKFHFHEHPDTLFALEKKLLDLYNRTPSVEIWNLESMNIFFRQIEFYRDSQVFASDEDIYRLYEAMEKLWGHLEKQASLGYKFNYGDPEQKKTGELKMFFNEVLLGDNNMLVELDGVKMSYVAHTTINFMFTKDEGFNNNMYKHLKNQMKRSTPYQRSKRKGKSKVFPHHQGKD